MKRYCLVILANLAFLIACKKEEPGEDRFCWQRIDNFGNNLDQVCDKTEAEMKALYPGDCGYYKTDGEKSCWLIHNAVFPNTTREGAELMARCFYGGNVTPQKVACDYCRRWYHRQKRTYKPTGSFAYSPTTSEQFCGDTATKLFQGRQVVLRETADSLIIVQFSNDGVNW